MKKKHTKLECLFGYHRYGSKVTRDKNGVDVRLCKVCRRSGYYKYKWGPEVWRDYDKEGNEIRVRIKWN